MVDTIYCSRRVEYPIPLTGPCCRCLPSIRRGPSPGPVRFPVTSPSRALTPRHADVSARVVGPPAGPREARARPPRTRTAPWRTIGGGTPLQRPEGNPSDHPVRAIEAVLGPKVLPQYGGRGGRPRTPRESHDSREKSRTVTTEQIWVVAKSEGDYAKILQLWFNDSMPHKQTRWRICNLTCSHLCTVASLHHHHESRPKAGILYILRPSLPAA